MTLCFTSVNVVLSSCCCELLKVNIRHLQVYCRHDVNLLLIRAGYLKFIFHSNMLGLTSTDDDVKERKEYMVYDMILI